MGLRCGLCPCTRASRLDPGWLPPLFEKYVWGLHFLLFILAIPGTWAIHIVHRHLKGWAYWRSAFTSELCKETFRGAPKWAPKSLTYLFAYLVVHMGILLIRTKDVTIPVEIAVGQTPLYVFVVSSAAWIFAYGFVGAVFYSALHADEE
jgi:hypothetical protein